MRIAIVGATGAVGEEFLQILEGRGFSGNDLRLLASKRSAGKSVQYAGSAITIKELTKDSFSGVDTAFFSAGGGISREFAPAAVSAGAVVIDNSSAFRMTDDVPLVIPEINPDDVATHKGVIANPNCSTIIMLMAVAPIHRAFGVDRVVVSTYQAASGAGRLAMLELEEQSRDYLAGKAIEPKVFPHPIAFNLFSHNSAVGENGYNEEEIKMINESRKILHVPDMKVTATCVRVAVLRAHSEAINVTLTKSASPEHVREVIAAAPGLKIVDDPSASHFPMPIESAGADDVLVGRIRADLSQPAGRGIELFVSGDQLRKGAALNAIQIADVLAGCKIGAA